MTQVIDIEQRARARALAMPTTMFMRRTDKDRRPATVVLRPNDSPGDLSVRQQLARELREAADRKRIVIDKPPSNAEKARLRREDRKMAMLALASGYRLGLLVRDSVETLGITYDLAGILAGELAFEGLVEKDVSGKPGGGRSLTIAVTDAGRELLESLAP